MIRMLFSIAGVPATIVSGGAMVFVLEERPARPRASQWSE